MQPIPERVKEIDSTLRKGDFESYLVGGCVRDLIIGRKPKDWDLTTNATPEQIQALFSDTFYENAYGTVGVVSDETDDETLKVIEITPYRTETTYTDFRRPDAVKFAKTLDEDLGRRDFTMNAIAYDISKGHFIDPYKGQEDIQAKLIKTVGSPIDRFTEDALRMLRAVRLSAELGFACNAEAISAIFGNVFLLKHISKERIRGEFIKIVLSDSPMSGLAMCEKLGMLEFIAPVLRETVGVEQNKQAHKYDVWEHLLRSLQHAADKKYSLEVRLAALFHDVSKPQTKREIRDRQGKVVNCTFFGHEVIGARVTRETLLGLQMPKNMVEKVEKLVRWHMFLSDTEQITLSAVRRVIANVGKENVEELMDLRTCDRIGSGRPVENPYRLRKYRAMIDEAMRDPISVGMLAIDGNSLISEFKMEPGRKIGLILHALLGEVLDDPQKNTKEYLLKRAEELIVTPETELVVLGERGRVAKAEEDEKIIQEIRGKHNVK